MHRMASSALLRYASVFCIELRSALHFSNELLSCLAPFVSNPDLKSDYSIPALGVLCCASLKLEQRQWIQKANKKGFKA